VFARPVDYNWIRSGEIPSTPTSGMGTGVIIGTGTAVGYVAPVAPVTSTTLVVPGSDYLKTVYPNWGRTCNNGKCTIVHHSRKSKINSKSRKNINC
jgi:hypothetical protein